jgi:hypothetical protein
MKPCQYQCQKFEDLRTTIKATWDCEKCTFLADLEKFLLNRNAYPVMVRESTINAAREVFGSPQHTNNIFSCNVLKLTIKAPCKLDGCPWWLHNAATMNCLKHYLTTRGEDNITPEEFSWLYKMPYDVIKSLYTTHIVQLQRFKFQKRLDSDVRWQYIPSTKICCVCESSIDSQPHHVEGGQAWCSDICFYKKEPWVVRVESIFEASITTVMRKIIQTFKALSVAQQVLGLTKFQMRIVCNRYLKSNIYELFTSKKQMPSDGMIKYKGEQHSWIREMLTPIREYRLKAGNLSPDLLLLSKQISLL